MRIVDRVEPFEGGDRFRLWGLGDFHLGAPDCDEAALRRHVKLIAADEHARWIGMGDYGDLIDPRRDHRADSYPIPVRYRDAQYADGGIVSETVCHACEILEPIAGKCLGLIGGNHEEKVRRTMDRSVDAEIAKELGILNKHLGYTGFIRWRFKRRSSTARGGISAVGVHVHHGWQAGRRPGARVNQAQLEKAMYPSADIIMRGHAHERDGKVYDAVVHGQYHVRDAPYVYVCTGSYKLGRVDTTVAEPVHTTWEERKGFGPKARSRMGPPVITVIPHNRNGEHPTDPAVSFEVTL
jgi:hypothetical protein